MRTPASLPELLFAATERRPDAIAVVDGERRLPYGELWTRICAVAGFLRDAGVSAGDRVALLMENSIDYVIAYYAVQVAGGACVALNTASKARDIVNWARHSDAKLLLADAQHPELAAVRSAIARELPIVAVGESVNGAGTINWSTALAAAELAFDPSAVDAAGLASIIYTSGTTGHPKGVCLSHRNLCSNVQSILDYLQLSADDSIVNVLPFFYSYGNSILHTHLAAGARLVLEKSMLYPVQVLKRMADERVSGFSGVPSTYSILLNRVDMNQYDLSSLRYMTQAGGPMAPADIQRLTSTLPNVRFFVMYGQTEASARLTYLPPERLFDKLGSIGIAIPGVRIEVRDSAGSATPVGQHGELCACGDNIMQGYWKDPAMSHSVLRDGWLHTGDLAYRDEDGYLFIVGRASDMIKSGAHRISPKDIEEVVLELDGVAEVVAVGIPDELLGQVIKLIVVKRPGAELDPMAIQRHCKQNLASYKIPKTIEFADTIPRTSSGKVQRFKLQQG